MAFSKARLERLSGYLKAQVESGAVAGAVALLDRKGETRVEIAGAADLETAAPMQRDTVFRIASMTKTVTAVAALMLVEEARIRLDDPVDPWLPELADRKVLKSWDGPADDTVPADRAITLRDLLTFRMGFGALMERPGRYPIQAAIQAAGLMPGPVAADLTPDLWMARLGALPLLHQPGERWMYHTGSDVLGVLIARLCGQPLDVVMRERIFEPLGMADTGFHAAGTALDRLATAYIRDPANPGALKVYDKARGGSFSSPPSFPAGGGGLVSTADDFLTFARMLMTMGKAGRTRLLARPTVELMTTDQLTPEQKARSAFFPGFWDYNGWGLGVSVTTARNGIALNPGSFGWDGGFGTSWRSDPREDMTVILLIQRMMGGAADAQISRDVLTLAYQAIDD